MSDRKTFLLRLDAEDLEALRQWADEEFRSLNGQIEFVLRQALKRQRGYKSSPRDRPAPGPAAP